MAISRGEEMAVPVLSAQGRTIQLATIIWTLAAAGMTGVVRGAVDPDDLRPGLIAVYRDSARPTPREVVQLDPILAINWKANESAHPRLEAEGGTVRWEGSINVLRAGVYQFGVRLRGKFRLQVAGKEVVSAEVAGAAPIVREGPETRLESGAHALIAEFTRLPGAARVEVLWQGPYFQMEPLGYEVLGHLPKNRHQARLEANQMIERGRFLAEEGNCTSCHQAADGDKIAQGLSRRQGPDLSQIGGRVHGGWIYEWLGAPHNMRPGTVMPEMFSHDELGRAERNLVARFLVSLGGPVNEIGKKRSPKEIAQSAERGKHLFNAVGCVACHGSDDGKKEPAAAPRSFHGLVTNHEKHTAVPLAGLGNKTIAEKLAEYLENPLVVDPSGRMPHLLLQKKEAQDLARYLCQNKQGDIDTELPEPPTKEEMNAVFKRVDSRAEELAAFRRLSEQAQMIELGQRLVIDKRCNQCHNIAPQGKPFASVLARASFDDLKKPSVHNKGCLADLRSPGNKAPRFNLEAADREALRLFLAEGTTGAGSAAPAYNGRVALARFNCLACHSKDGEGGLTAGVLEGLRRYEKAEYAESVSAPPLTGVGHKLRTPWLTQVLTQGGRARPWMGLRMPQFGPANVGHLAQALALMEGTDPDDQVHKVPLTAAKLEAGRTLIGRQAFGCISCHDIAGVVSTGTRGPDMALMNQRVRYSWYRRWMEHAQRMQPGTRMPTVFPDGKSPLPAILEGNADAQAEAMWAFLSLGPGLPLPEGVGPPKGLVVQVKDRPVLVRTFMPEAGSRAVSVGYPKEVSVAFDATTCRLAYAWSGNFLDATPVWDNRGGNPAKLLGGRFWTAPAGCPLAVTFSAGVPDFAERATDSAYGGPIAEGKLYEGPSQLHFEGYDMDKNGLPIFRYRINAEESAPVEVQERPEPLRSPVAVGVSRHLAFNILAQESAWFLAGESNGEPRFMDARGCDVKLDLKQQAVELPEQGQFVVLPQGGDKVVVVTAPHVPQGTRWHVGKYGSVWQLLLRLPMATENSPVQMSVNVWAPYGNDAGLLKELVAGGVGCGAGDGGRKPYPPTRTDNVVETLHGVKVSDPYRWLEDAKSPEVAAWVDKQNAYTESILGKLPGRARIRERLGQLLDIGTLGVPVPRRGRYFYTKREGKQNQAILYVREGLRGTDRVLVDPNHLSKEGTISLDWWFPSLDGAFIAYGLSKDGSELSTLYVRDVATGRDLPDVIERARYCSLAWLPDGKGFYYTRYPTAGSVPKDQENYHHHVYFHALGADPARDPKVFGEGRPAEDMPEVLLSPDGRWLVVKEFQGWAKSEIFFKDLKKADAPFVPLVEKIDAVFEAVVRNDRFFVRTNEKAPRYRVYQVDPLKPGRKDWKEVIPEGKDVLDDLGAIGDHLVGLYMHQASSRLRLFDWNGQPVQDVSLPTLGTVDGLAGEWDGHEVMYGFQSFTLAPTVYRLDLTTRRSELWEQVRTDIPFSDYQIEQVSYPSKDGTSVTMFLAYKKGLARTGINPTLLYAYGGFNISLTPTFSASRFLFLERGGLIAIPNLRGGGEYGEQWHQSGMLGKKQNVFDDFIAAAEWLRSQKYTDKAHLAIEGRSNGGLLMGAVLTQRPDLFRAAVCGVPLLDMVRYHRFLIARLWIPEYGSAEDPQQFQWLYAYSPYHHVKDGTAYPAVLIETAESDSRVDALHARKMAARLQAASSSDRPILLRLETKAGHGAGKPRSKQLDELTDTWCFVLGQLGLEK
jgi:prolyl oligopeptidase PreP (S9A serine peptidase family)/mono/diheme cytochrome c family protein